MSAAFLSEIEAAARRVRAAFGETQAKLLLDYRQDRPPRAAPTQSDTAVGAIQQPFVVLRARFALQPQVRP
jgi:hypothetical protein